MYKLELTLKYTPFPISIQKKEHSDILHLFNDIKNSMNNPENRNIIELKCDKIKDKLVAVIANEISSVQIYEKSSVAGSKRPGFSLED